MKLPYIMISGNSPWQVCNSYTGCLNWVYVAGHVQTQHDIFNLKSYLRVFDLLDFFILFTIIIIPCYVNSYKLRNNTPSYWRWFFYFTIFFTIYNNKNNMIKQYTVFILLPFWFKIYLHLKKCSVLQNAHLRVETTSI